MTVSFNIIGNDSGGSFALDLNSIDLQPGSTGTVENSISIPDVGDFSVDATGEVTFSPAQDFFGDATASYTIKNLNPTPETSNEATITVTVNAVNDVPTITAIADQTIDEDTQTSILDFTIDDVETDPATMTPTGTSDNPLLVPDANIVFGGSGQSRTVQVTPLPDANGVANITITVSDGTDDNTIVFELTVTAINDEPTITAITNQTIDEDTQTPILDFTIGDVETDPATMTPTGTSDNPLLVPDANIVFGGSGQSRTVQVTPLADASGVANITVTVSDGTDDNAIVFD